MVATHLLQQGGSFPLTAEWESKQNLERAT
jgi:hypothetical protein